MIQLRPYQTQAVSEVIQHFKKSRDPAVIVLPTGAGKSLVIAELARVAKGRVLILAHVKELVEQNYQKYIQLGHIAGIFSAGLERKDISEKIIFGSIQSIARAEDTFFHNFSLLIIDECHRVNSDSEDNTQYMSVIEKMKNYNSAICILGLTATPYRLGFGWIYEYHQSKKIKATDQLRFFKKCLFELSLKYMIENNYLTRPVQIDSPVACYDFSSLRINGTSYILNHIEELLKNQKRITPVIIENIVQISETRNAVMIFTSTVDHAKEILNLLPKNISEIVTGATPLKERDQIIEKFKNKNVKFLVNVSVLTTGFDAPHVDVIAILRPTESVSLYQQIVGRGLRLAPNKIDCLILDYTGQSYNIYQPEIEDHKPDSKSQIVDIICPKCQITNQFWGLMNKDGFIEEHYGRKCQGAFLDSNTQTLKDCGFLFRYKHCDQCGAENDIAARKCNQCQRILIDTDKKLKEAMSLKDSHVMRVDSIQFRKSFDKKNTERLEIHYYDADAEVLKEFFYINSYESLKAFEYHFIRMHTRLPGTQLMIKTIDAVLAQTQKFRQPTFVIARKNKKFWTIREKIFY